MSQKNNRGNSTNHEKRGYRPGSGGSVTNGHTPEKSERKPIKPPKKK